MPIDTCKTILQVEGTKGFDVLMLKLTHGQIAPLYQGALATLLATIAGHYPWFLVHNCLDAYIATRPTVTGSVIRNAFIGFSASAVSDTFSNFIRVIKTVKQTYGAENIDVSYIDVIRIIYDKDGWVGLMTRGLGSRILTNGVQSVVFTIIWKLLAARQLSRDKRIHSELPKPSSGDTLGGRVKSGAGALEVV